MFKIFGIAPGTSMETLITSRPSKKVADDYVKNLAAFGYKNLRVESPSPPPTVPVVPPAPVQPVKA